MAESPEKAVWFAGLLRELDDSVAVARYFIYAAVFCEVAGVTAFLIVMDFGDRLHWLMFVLGLMVYAPLGCWVLATLFLTRHWTTRISQQVEQIARRQEERQNPDDL